MPISRTRRIWEIIAGFYFLLVALSSAPSVLLLLLLMGFSDSGTPDYSNGGITFLIIGFLTILLSVASLATAIGVFMGKTWGRILGIIVSVGAVLFSIHTASDPVNLAAIIADIYVLIDIALVIFFVSYFTNKKGRVKAELNG